MHTHPDTHIRPVYLHTGMHTCAHRYITCTQTMSTSGTHVLMQKHIPKCMHMPLHKYVCTQTHSLVYTCVHTGPGMLAYPDPSAYHGTPTYIQTQNCLCAYRWHQSHVHTCSPAYRTTFKDLYMYIYIYRHVFCTQCTHSHTGSSLSVFSNHEFTGRPLVSSTIRLAQAPLPPAS